MSKRLATNYVLVILIIILIYKQNMIYNKGYNIARHYFSV
jgi:hypothetical protein